MELTSNLQGEQPSQSQDESDEVLSATFREWVSAMPQGQVMHLLANGSGADMVDYLIRQSIPMPTNPHNVWDLLRRELVLRLETFHVLHAKAGTA
ncbi:MAG: hypothetical protein KIT40_04470 [Nitrospira sp.]|nr:hypothetical protein [Nitrospira sp.]